MAEILHRGKVPIPDRLLEGEITVATDRLSLNYGGARFEGAADGSYHLTLTNPREQLACSLTLHPEKPPIRHGDQGVVRGKNDEEMFYYFIPRCKLTGTLTLAEDTHQITSGSGWYDHEFGGEIRGGEIRHPPSARTPVPPALSSPPTPTKDIAWNWAAVQLAHGYEISAYALYQNGDDGALLYQWAIVVDPQGEAHAYADFRLEPLAWWRSIRTFNDYPVGWRLVIPEAQVELEILADFPDQEFITVLSKPAFWEGRCTVRGTHHTEAVQGLGYIERSGFETAGDLDQFFGAVSEVVRSAVEKTLPLKPSFVQARDLVASAARSHYLDHVDLGQLARSLIAPIRSITDRGGKSWRSYAALACCDVVGGDSRRFAPWLAMPELLHVGSLIIDDVQDRSTVRRGGPACHQLYGEALAINAGTAAYFLTQHLLNDAKVSDTQKLRLYDLYFEAMRAGHAGQALDLDGMEGLLREVTHHADTKLLEQRVLATYRLKTAAPAGALARMGAVVGGGSEAQIEAVGAFFEAVGLAFQLIDDVLNVRGFKGELKSPGEDLANGTVTLPIAKAMAEISTGERHWLCAALLSKPRDNPALISEVTALLESCGALSACQRQAEQLVEAAWQRAEPLLEDSMPKLMLRAFGWYVLERHY
jgi:geranylgeranyl pyrophosphate synthase